VREKSVRLERISVLILVVSCGAVSMAVGHTEGLHAHPAPDPLITGAYADRIEYQVTRADWPEGAPTYCAIFRRFDRNRGQIEAALRANAGAADCADATSHVQYGETVYLPLEVASNRGSCPVRLVDDCTGH